MLSRLRDRFLAWERSVRTSFGDDISTPGTRRAARRHYLWIDHGVLRILWKNFHEIAPGVYRSNQPSAERLAEFRDMGIRTVVNLRGPSRYSPYLFEREACEALGLTLVNCHIHAATASRREQLLHLLDTLPTLERPFVMHCKSGADRAGLASALYLIHVEGASISEARRQLALRYLHLTFTGHGILDFLLDRYERAHAETGIALRDWVARDYDAEGLQRDFDAARGGFLRRRRG